VRQGLILKLFLLSLLFVSGASAQTESQQSERQQPLPQAPRPSTGIQITNSGVQGAEPGDREYLRAEQQAEQEASHGRQRAEQEALAVRRLPPEPDIEFQDFVSSTLGYRLPIFGQNLFHNIPSTFAPLDHVPVTPDYLIGPGDELLIRAWGQIDVNYRATVDRTGTIYLPKVGAISVAGVRYDQINDVVRTAVGRVFKNFDLSVTMGRLRSIQVFVVGQVRRPGSYTVSSLSTLVNALFASGGPSKRGSMRNIQLKRQGKTVTSFDLYDLLASGDKSHDAQLLPGDVIYVAPVGPLVALAGSVNDPAIYELKGNETFGDLLHYAGGMTTTAGGQHAFVDRIEKNVRTTTEFPLNASGMKQELHDGDIIRFLHISPRFDNAIILRGNVAVPGRYPWHEGMRVKDLIPTRESLVTEEFWKRQNALAINPESRSFQLRGQRGPQGQEYPYPQYGNEPYGNQTYGNEPSSIAPMGSAAGQASQQRTNQPYNNQNQPLFDSSGFPMEQPNYNDQRQQMSRTEAERKAEEELKNQVKRSAAEINWEYAVIQRMDTEDLTTHLLPFNLGKAIAGDVTQNLELQPGDIITIFSQSDMQVPIGQQSKFVRLEGEFKSAGVYQVQPGETLRHLITRVGGFTPQAYLYGAEFTRESVREDQQERLDQYVNDLEKSIERGASSQRNLTPEEALAERQSLEGQRRLLDKLRQLKATGRIVLELKPNATSLLDFPDLVLEDGDRLLVPFRPATVNVIGSVYNTNSFIYKPGKTFGDYLKLAGGTTQNGDKGRAFVIRADGTTVSKHGHSGLIVNNFDRTKLMAGDTIVVPEKLDKGVVLRGFKDWTQIVGQFVLGAAAAKVLFP
jgi:protein involved in polysaccharide export with SLBB domain